MVITRLAAIDSRQNIVRWRTITWSTEVHEGQHVEIYEDVFVEVAKVRHLMATEKGGVEVVLRTRELIDKILADPNWKTSRKEADAHSSFLTFFKR